MKYIDDEFVKTNQHIFTHKKAVILVGAGISVASGIPDFRSPTGIFASLRQQLKINGKDMFTYNFGIKEGTRQIYLKYIADLKTLCDNSQPNEMHTFLSNFPKSRVYTQNIDGLEERAGMTFTKSDDTKGVYLHGNLSKLNCQYCGYKREFTSEDIIKFSKAEEIECNNCLERREVCIKNNIRKRPIGLMHPGIIHYQQAHPDGAFIGKMIDKDKDCDLFIVIGTSLKVDGIKKMVKTISKYQGVQGKRIYVNLSKPTKEWEDVFDYFYEGDCNEFVKNITGNKEGQTEFSFINNVSERRQRVNSNKINNETDSSKVVFENETQSVRTRATCKTDSSGNEIDENVSCPKVVIRKSVENNFNSTKVILENKMQMSSRRSSIHSDDLNVMASINDSRIAKENVALENNSTKNIIGLETIGTKNIASEHIANENINNEHNGYENINNKNTTEDNVANDSIASESNNHDLTKEQNDSESKSIHDSFRRLSVKDSDKIEEYLTCEEIVADDLLNQNLEADKSELVGKIEILSQTFDNKDLISKPILNEMLKSTVTPVKIKLNSSQIVEVDENYVANQPDSSFMSLEAEIENVVTEAVGQESSKFKKPVIKLTPKKKSKNKN